MLAQSNVLDVSAELLLAAAGPVVAVESCLDQRRHDAAHTGFISAAVPLAVVLHSQTTGGKQSSQWWKRGKSQDILDILSRSLNSFLLLIFIKQKNKTHVSENIYMFFFPIFLCCPGWKCIGNQYTIFHVKVGTRPHLAEWQHHSHLPFMLYKQLMALYAIYLFIFIYIILFIRLGVQIFWILGYG